MSYIENSLLKNEKIIYFTRMHWIIFYTPAILWLVTVLMFMYGPHLFPIPMGFGYFKMYELVGLLCLFIALFSTVTTYIRYKTSEYGITNKRILIKLGWISRTSLEIFLDKVEAIYVDQSIPGRIFSYGTLRIIGTGGTQDPFSFVPDPLTFRKLSQQQVDIQEQEIHKR